MISSSNHLLDSIGEDDQTYEDTYCPIQVPHLRLLPEHFSTDEDGEAHDSAHQRVESWKETKRIQVFLWKLSRPQSADEDFGDSVLSLRNLRRVQCVCACVCMHVCVMLLLRPPTVYKVLAVVTDSWSVSTICRWKVISLHQSVSEHRHARSMTCCVTQSVLQCWVRARVWTPTVSDEGSAREHSAEHKLDHSQDEAHQAADDGHAEQESVLLDTESRKPTWLWGPTHCFPLICETVALNLFGVLDPLHIFRNPEDPYFLMYW